MKLGQSLRLSQSLTMTPQLQQAIRLLQLSGLELHDEIQQALESNMMLEVADDERDFEGPDEYESRRQESESATDSGAAEAGTADLSGDSTGNEFDGHDGDAAIESPGIPDDLPVDSTWDDTYDGGSSGPRGFDDDDLGFEQRASAEENLYDHLRAQLNLCPLSERDQIIALAIIDAIDDDGYLKVSLEEIAATVEDNVECDEVEAVLHQIQNFDPPGVGARDLRESLLLQLAQLDPDTPKRDEALRLVTEFFDLLAQRDHPQLLRRMRLSMPELQESLTLIQTLNPRPGNAVTSSRIEYIVPDVFVRRTRGRWTVELNNEAMPKIRVNSRYENLIRRADKSADNVSLKAHLQEARWFIECLHRRGETLLNVASEIVKRQQAFLELGAEHMKPMVLHAIADALEMHESTISRVTSRKYIHTPRGIYELKYFFSSHVSTSGGGECSSTAIRAKIQKMIAEESPRKPLSDSKIASVLLKEGINVARRTVAKYRESLALPPSHERKRLS